MEPISLIVSALAAGALAALKPTAEQAVKDAYAGLRSLVVRKFKGNAASVEQLEGAPDSKARRAVVEEDLGKSDAAQDAAILQKAQALIAALEAHDPDAARVIGIDLSHIKAGVLNLSDVVATGSGPVTGVQVEDAEITGEIKITGVRAAGSGTPQD